MTVVVNFKKEKCDVKITRTFNGEVTEPPKFGCFGNPFKLEDYGREKCIELFREYLFKRVMEDVIFREAVLTLQGKRLGCFCKPQACHGDVIKEWLDLHEALAEVMKSEFIMKWLETPNKTFDENKPIDIIKCGDTDKIWQQIYYLKSGISV